MSKLRISDQLLLPKDTVTSTLIVYGGKGMGKTNCGAVLVEEFSKLNLRWCALDPLGVWWGLRYSQDGKSAGVECLILGGSHADFPIEPTGGAVVADMVIEEPANFIIDFSRKPSGEMWSIGEKIRFITDYAYRLFQRQGELISGVRREPIFQLLDEAARYIPQIIPAGNPQLAMCVAAWEQLVEEGRNIGIGVGLLTQRSARMNKSVSEVADAILSFRIVGPNSIGAIMDWLGEHVPKERIKTMIEEVRSLERGSCLVVSPGWLQFEGVIKIRERQTFDSSATPKPGERARRVSGEGAKPDLDKYAARMLATIERTKENDPKTLKAQIAQLRKELAAKHDQKVPIGTKVDQKAIERAVAAAVKPYREILRKLKQHADRGDRSLAIVRGAFEDIAAASAESADLPSATAQAADAIPGSKAQPTIPARPAVIQFRRDSSAGESIPKGEQTILCAIAQYPDGAQRDQLTVLTGYKRSTRDAYIQRLKEKQFVIEVRDGVQATQEGVSALGSAFEPLPTGEALQEYWLNRLPDGEGKILAALLQKPEGLSRDHLEELTGYKRSTRDAYIQRLQSRRLVEIMGRGEVRPTEILFA